MSASCSFQHWRYTVFVLFGITFTPLGFWALIEGIFILLFFAAGFFDRENFSAFFAALIIIWFAAGLCWVVLTIPQPPPPPAVPTPTATPTPSPNTIVSELQIWRTYRYTTQEWQTYAGATDNEFRAPPANVLETRNLRGLAPDSQASASGGGIVLAPPAVASGDGSSSSGLYMWDGLTVVQHDAKIACQLTADDVVECADSEITADQMISAQTRYYVVLYQPTTGNSQVIEVDFDTFKQLEVGQSLPVYENTLLYIPSTPTPSRSR